MGDTGQKPAMNAMKHGILAKAVVVHTGLTTDAQETQGEFDGILADLVAHYAPMGPVEAMMVETIAVQHWRLRRVLWAEAAQCAERVTNAGKEAIEDTKEIDDEAAEFEEEAAEIRSRGKLTRAQRGRYGPYATVESVAARLEESAKAKERESETTFNRRVQFYSAPAFEEQTEVRSRYETHLSRQLHKAIEKLHELQAARLGTGSGSTRKPRRGASRAKPQYLHVVSRAP